MLFIISSRYLPVAIALLVVGCTNSTDKKDVDDAPLFTLLPSEKTHVDFVNTLKEGPNTNVMMYEYFYNGGGVAVGDLNNDGLDDLYFSSNMSSNKLYLNKGNMEFEDVTEQSGAGARNGPWKTGVSMADVNGDGLLDIYVCYSGNLRPERKIGQLFVNLGADNNGVPRFQDKAAEYGLAYPANSTQAIFFDYDKDNDLDLFLLNHNPQTLPPVDDVAIAELVKEKNPITGLRLLENSFRDGKPFFTDVTIKAGIHTSPLSYGLGCGIADLNSDGWPDIYVSNDYIAPDYLYINNKNGTFSDAIRTSMGHVSHFSMGNDIADINNDGLSDVYTLDMLPEDNKRQKLLFAPDNYERFDINLRSGLHYQYMRNMLHVNNGDGSFSEVGQLAGISNTDWSWAALFADYDNDGWKDLFVTNGYVRDFTNMDFTKYMTDVLRKANRNPTDENLLDLIHQMPASDVVNYIYKNDGQLNFSSKGKGWGMTESSNSNGAAYSDLDNDGDLDLIVNNINKPAFIYRNESSAQAKNHFLKIKLKGVGYNRFGIGAKVKLYSSGKIQFLEQMPARGFQSSVSPVLHFGLGNTSSIDSLHVIWPSGKQQLITNLKADQLVELDEKAATNFKEEAQKEHTLFAQIESPVEYNHAKAEINDFKRQPLLVNPLSFAGPCFAKGDVNKDGLEDLYAGGGNGKAGIIYLQQRNGKFLLKRNQAIEADNHYQDSDAIFFDANGDGSLDLYVASGGYHNLAPADPLLHDRLYFGDGKGNFKKTEDALPSNISSKGCVAAGDVNGDGYTDLFVGGRVVPGRYPETPTSFLLVNNGKGQFSDNTAKWNNQLSKVGMVTDAAFADLNGDKKDDLILVGEWMPVTVLINANNKLENKSSDYFDKSYAGWWNVLLLDDFNGDGKQDLVIGNNGLNSQCKATEKEPAVMYYKDFDENGSVDPILTMFIQGKSYPYVSRDELLDQMSIMRTRFPNYKSYADATLYDVFTKEELDNARELKANYLKTVLFVRNTNNRFVETELPIQAQASPVFTITSLDYNSDNQVDMLLCGNISNARLRFGKYDANYGVLLKNEGSGKFSYVPQYQSGLKLTGDIRSAVSFNEVLIFGVNHNNTAAYKLSNRKPTSGHVLLKR